MHDDEAEAAVTTMMCCASCGKAAADDITLKFCTACKLVKYCSVECQKNHREQHKKACKKRAAEIRDDKLFQQPDESHLGECPICCLPLPLDKWAVTSCCCKNICKGCEYANDLRIEEEGLEQRCVYCREPLPTTDEEVNQNYMERIKANDPVAFFNMGSNCYRDGDHEGAIPHWTKAAALGDMEAHFQLSLLYYEGKGFEKNMKKAVYHSEEAAIGGHPSGRHMLGCYEYENGRFDRAVKHWIIAAKQGLDLALETVKEDFTKGLVSKEDYEAALHGHQTAVDAKKSQQRDAAEEHDKQQNQED